METRYAILGATGSTGGSILSLLLQRPSTKINVFCRSKQKLLGKFPGIDGNKDVQIFSGNLEDISLMTDCLSGCRAAFHCVALSENQPGCSICMDTSKVIVAALKDLHTKSQPLPKLIVLSSCSTEHRLVQHVPGLVKNTLYRAMSNIYDDLKEAEKFIRSHQELFPSSFIKPAALSHDIQKGHSLSLENAVGPMSFLDLAAGMIEIAEDEDGKYEMRSVAVNPTATNVAFPWEAPACLLRGLIFHFFPWAYGLLGYR